MFPFVHPMHLIAGPFHQQKEILPAAAFLHGLCNLEHQFEFPTLALLRGTVLSGGEFLTSIFVGLEYGQVVGYANLIAEFPELLQGCGILPKLLPSFISHRVDDEVGMDMSRITVSGDLNLMTGPSLLCKRHSDLMRLRRSQLLPG